MLLNCGVGEDSWESLGLQGDPTLNPKGNQPWIFFGKTDAEVETAILWPLYAKSWLIGKDWCWERLRAGGDRDDRGWDGWMASLTYWTWVWANWEIVKHSEAYCAAVHRAAKSRTRLINWTKTTLSYVFLFVSISYIWTVISFRRGTLSDLFSVVDRVLGMASAH